MMGAFTVLQYYTLDGVCGWFFTPGFADDTEYACGYSDHAFRKVRLGMSADEVLALVGPPLDKYPRE